MVRFHEDIPLRSDVRDLLLLEHVRLPEDLHRVHVSGILLLHESHLYSFFRSTKQRVLSEDAGRPPFNRERLKAFSRSNLEFYERNSTCSAKRDETLLLLRSNERISLSPGRDYRLRQPLAYFRYYRNYYNHKQKSIFV